MAGSCHVQRLSIRTRDNACIPRMTFIIEEALRTASFSGIPANGTVYVRRLDLGRHSLSASSRIIAKRIDELCCNTRPVAITENTPDQPFALVVWFPDELSPCRFLLKLLSENHRPLCWYWQTAVKGWNPKLTISQGYQLILAHVSEQKTGISGMSFVFEPLFDNKTIHDVLNALDPKDASTLLLNMGIKPYHNLQVDSLDESKDEDAIESHNFNVSSDNADAVNKATLMWRAYDPRMMLLLYLVLHRTGQKSNPRQINIMLAKLVRTNVLGSSVNNEKGVEVNHITKGLKGNESKTGKIVDSNRCDPAKTAVNPDERQQGQEAEAGLEYQDAIEDRNAITEVRTTPQDVGRGSGKGINPVENSQHKSKSEGLFRKHDSTDYLPMFGGLEGEPSEYAGLIFLVPLLQRLGIETLLETNPAYEYLNLVDRIIFRCADLLHIPDCDPSLLFLNRSYKTVDHYVDFIAPPQWRRILHPAEEMPHLRICPITDTPGRRLFMDERGSLVLGVWHLKNRALIKSWIDASHRPFHHVSPRPWSLDHLVNNFIIAMSRYVWRYASMGLSGLIKRPGYIATTRTHLDVSIPFNRLDVRVRLAGLDIDPGWTPWLGRVIQFHYIGGEDS